MSRPNSQRARTRTRCSVLIASALLACPALSAQQTSPAEPSTTAAGAQDGDKANRFEDQGIAARGGGGQVSFEELGDLILRRHGMAQVGREGLREILDRQVVEAMAQEANLQITNHALNQRWKDLDEEVRADDPKCDGLRGFLQEQGVDPQVFREYLKLLICQETLARRALGIPKTGPISGEQQAQWLKDQILTRGYIELPHPWKTKVVAHCKGVEVSTEELLENLMDALKPSELRKACYDLLLEKLSRSRMPDVSDEGLGQAVDAEMSRKRARAEGNPLYMGVAYEVLLDKAGLSVALVRLDPATRAAALSHLWVDSQSGAQGLRKYYEAEREYFDGTYGVGVEAYGIFIAAAERSNKLAASFADARRELEQIRARIEGLEDFKRIAKRRSQDNESAKRDGYLGVIRRATEGTPPALQRELFKVLDTVEGAVSGTIVGPLIIKGGMLLACMGERAYDPSWEAMSQYVHSEQRKRFFEETLHRAALRTWLDEE